MDLARQVLGVDEPLGGAGLRFVPVEHTGNSNESPEEVAAVAGLVDSLLGSGPSWVDQEGERRVLRPQDVVVVAPYNAQVNALKEGLQGDVRVGTVDKFQGQEALVVIYSTATTDRVRPVDFVGMSLCNPRL